STRSASSGVGICRSCGCARGRRREVSAGRKKRVAILGGGVASLSAALELTAHEGWQELYEVTVYQIGWRLGGKCATGRGAHGRIEEHGIHIIQGWYHNAFRLLEAVYEERDRCRLAPDDPHRGFLDALQPIHGTIVTEYSAAQSRWTASP